MTKLSTNFIGKTTFQKKKKITYSIHKYREGIIKKNLRLSVKIR